MLLGRDRRLGIDGTHRRDQLEAVLVRLLSIFAIDLIEAALLDNHLHLLLRLRWSVAADWSDDEVVERWLRLKRPHASEAARRAYATALKADTERLEACRTALAYPAEFHKALKQTIAQCARSEDSADGPFWAGRYHSRMVLENDEWSLVFAALYVALNAVRAGIVDRPESAVHSTICYRIDIVRRMSGKRRSTDGRSSAHDTRSRGPTPPMSRRTRRWTSRPIDTMRHPEDGLRLAPIQSHDGQEGAFRSLNLVEYLELVDELGRTPVPGKRGSVPAHLSSLFERLDVDRDVLRRLLATDEPLRGSVIGRPDACEREARRRGSSRVVSAIEFRRSNAERN